MALDLMYSEVLDDVDTEFDVDLSEEAGDEDDELGYGPDEDEKKLAGEGEESEDGSSGEDNTY